MYRKIVTLAAAGVLAGAGSTALSAQALEVGTMAPDFEMTGATRFGVLDAPVKLSDFRGKTVVVTFCPRARTRG